MCVVVKVPDTEENLVVIFSKRSASEVCYALKSNEDW